MKTIACIALSGFAAVALLIGLGVFFLAERSGRACLNLIV